MKTKMLPYVSLAAFAAICVLPLPRFFAQAAGGNEDLPAEQSPDRNSKDPVQLLISYGHGSELRLSSQRGVVDPIGLFPHQLMPFALQFPGYKAGTPVAIGPLDGGEVVNMASVENIEIREGIVTFDYQPAAELSVGEDGIVRFGFRPAPGAGLYRLLVQLPGEEHLLQFGVGPHLTTH